MEILDQIRAVRDEAELICLVDVPTEECEQVINDTTSVPVASNVVESEDEGVYYVDIPDVFESAESRVSFVLEVLREDDSVDVDTDIVVAAQLPALDCSVVGTMSVSEQYIDDEIRTLFFDSVPPIETIQNALNVAISLSRTGQKGDPVGALFVVGDEEKVLDKSRPLNHNPFSGADVFIGDDVSVSIGEFAKLDGAFVISSTGRIVSASRYLEPRVHDADVPSGLGARHMAASGITIDSDAVSIVVSESDQKVRCFVNGEIVASADPKGRD